MLMISQRDSRDRGVTIIILYFSIKYAFEIVVSENIKTILKNICELGLYYFMYLVAFSLMIKKKKTNLF